MKKTSIIIVLILILATVMPASAYGHKSVGERISIFHNAEITFESGQPFHIMHGWTLNLEVDLPVGIYNFELDVDGVRYNSDYLVVTMNPGNDNPMSRLWVFNFPAGMSGTHTFNGNWYAPCQAVLPIEECPERNAPVLERATTVVITFE